MIPIKTFIPQCRFPNAARFISIAINVLIVTLFGAGCRNEPVTQQDAREMRSAIDRAVESRNGEALNKLIDEDALAARVERYMPEKPGFAMRRRISSGASGLRIGSELMGEISKGARYSFVRAYADSGTQHLIYRLFSDKGLNYHDWELVRNGNEARAADLMIYFTGETLAETLAGLLSGFRKEDIGPELAAQVTELRQLLRERDFERARRIYNAWPERIRDMRFMQLLHIQILAGQGFNSEYVAALEKFAVAFPEARNAPLLMVDAYLLTGNYKRALEATNRLDSFVKGDPFLIFYRGLISKIAGDSTAYYDYTRKAYAASKEMEEVVLEMLLVAARQGDAAAATDAERVFRANPRFNAARLASVQAEIKSQ